MSRNLWWFQNCLCGVVFWVLFVHLFLIASFTLDSVRISFPHSFLIVKRTIFDSIYCIWESILMFHKYIIYG